MAQEPKSQNQDASSSPASESKGPPRGGQNHRGAKGKGGRPSQGKDAAGRGDGPKKGGGRSGGKQGGKGGGRRERNPSNAPLTTGLFSGLADKQLPCKIKGCKRTFLWTAQQQLRSFGKPPPQRMCEYHAGQLYDLSDKEIPCRNAPSCKNTWIWKRGAQLHALERQGGEGELRTPSRLCETCYGKEKELKDQDVECRTAGCSRTWVWTRDAQIRHRAWLRRELAKEAKREQAKLDEQETMIPAAEADAASGGDSELAAASPAPEGTTTQQAGAELASEPAQEAVIGKGEGKKRKRKKKGRRLQEGPPERHCKACAERFAKLAPVELPCKVHGCKKTWTWDRVSQLKAWVALGTDDVDAPVKPAKRMCQSCRDFCKQAKERDVSCANETCENTWRFKVGAQLQHVLATGGIQDPRRLCETCIKEQYKEKKRAKVEPMPCAQPGCDGTWYYVSGMPLEPFEGDETPGDRLCNCCREKRGLPPRSVSMEEAEKKVQASEASLAEETEIPAAPADLDAPGIEAAQAGEDATRPVAAVEGSAEASARAETPEKPETPPS